MTIVVMNDLTECERIIERGKQAFVEVGQALLKIKEQGWYKRSHGTFEDYCQERWGWNRAHAYRLIEAAEIVDNLSPIGDTPMVAPTTETQVRPLAKLPPTEQQAAWTEAVAESGGTVPTQRVVEQVVDRRIEAREERKAEKLATLESHRDKPVAAGWGIQHGDCIEELNALGSATVRLIFTDPPYNIGIDYGDGKEADEQPDAVFVDWCSRWMEQCHRVLTDDGSLWLMINDEYAAEFAVTLKQLGFTIRNWIKWYETFGVNCTNKFNRSSRHIFYCVKDAGSFVFNTDPIRRQSARQVVYNDSRAADGGKLWDDVWTIPRLVGTAAERLPEFPTQLPLELVETVVLVASEPGDLIVDPFNGSGTTGAVAIKNGRRYLGIERNARFHELATLRLKGMQ